MKLASNGITVEVLHPLDIERMMRLGYKEVKEPVVEAEEPKAELAPKKKKKAQSAE